MRIVGAVLAGGASSRMGTDKSMLSIGGTPAIKHICTNLEKVVNELVLITHKPDQYDFLNIPVYQDVFPGKGPLAGLHSVMYHKPADAYLLAACDMPFLNQEVCEFLVKQLPGYDAVLPVYAGKRQPLAAVIGYKAFPVIQRMLEENQLKIGLLFEQIRTKEQCEFPFPDKVLVKHFFNMNHPHEYEKAKEYFTN
ncbi:molybdenum cofactor guanylyltransferase [Aciduricibacillus chroicocephali]|uniref:Probable molybdenum cofactor guanylyltransferase n=1 Tax=Aciduricibacillus chroicocephali TaxID=3054939 RepID=A0ABY9KYU8_9BACI|nr:molybdenum cofactor guanylyltransferase [Bacillaceae bacterium 44XB]